MKITTEESQKLKQHLPKSYARLIQEKLAEANISISTRHILNIVNGGSEDYCGVIDIATEMALAEKNKNDTTQYKLKQL